MKTKGENIVMLRYVKTSKTKYGDWVYTSVYDEEYGIAGGGTLIIKANSNLAKEDILEFELKE